MAGEGEEGVVERGAAERDVGDGHVRLVERADDPEQRGAGRDRGGDLERAGVAVGELGRERGDRPGGGVELVGAAQRDDHPLAADAGLELGRGAAGDHAPAVDHRDAVGEPVGLLEVLGGEEQRRAVVDELAQDGPEGVARVRVEPGRRLVEEQHGRRRDQAGREVEPAPHAAGVGAREAVAVGGEAEALEQLVRPLARGLAPSL